MHDTVLFFAITETLLASRCADNYYDFLKRRKFRIRFTPFQGLLGFSNYNKTEGTGHSGLSVNPGFVRISNISGVRNILRMCTLFFYVVWESLPVTSGGVTSCCM